MSVSGSGSLVSYDWSPDLAGAVPFTLMLDTARKSTLRHSSWELTGLSPRTASLDATCEHIVCGGWWDGSLRIVAVLDGRVLAVGFFHECLVVALALDAAENLLVSGDERGNVVLWSVCCVPGKAKLNNPAALFPKHSSRVTAVAISVELDVAVSGSADGTLHIYSLRELNCIYILRPAINPAWAPGGEHLNWEASIESICLSAFGTVVVQCAWLCPQLPERKKPPHSLHVYNINGRLLCVQVCKPINCIRTSVCGEFLVAAGNKSVSFLRSIEYDFLFILSNAQPIHAALHHP